MYLLGRILGWLIVSAYLLTLFNYPVKLINRKYIIQLARESRIRRAYTRFMQFIVSGHRYFAILATLLLFAHFIIQYSQYGIRPTGVIAGALMLTQATLGAYGMYIRKRQKTAWFYVHRTVAATLFAAILVHVLKLWR